VCSSDLKHVSEGKHLRGIRAARGVLGVVVAIGMLAAVPATVFAAQPSCGDTLNTSTTLSADLDCSAYNGNGLTVGANGIVINLNGHTLWGYTGDDGYRGIDTNNHKNLTIRNGTIANWGAGVYLDASVNSVVKGLTITGEAADSDDQGVSESYGVGNTLNRLHISGMYEGLNLYGAAETLVTNNHMSDVEYGVYSEYDSNDRFVANTASYTYAGFYDDYSSHQTYRGNHANGGGAGSYGFYIDCDDYGYTKAINNTATGNTADGFYFYYCYDDSNQANGSTFTGNVANDNTGGGFYDSFSVNSTWLHNTAKRNGSDGFALDYSGLVVFKYNVANRNSSDGIRITNNYGTGYGNFKDFSYNTANGNDFGMSADYGVPGGAGDVALNNTSGDCYNVRCN